MWSLIPPGLSTREIVEACTAGSSASLDAKLLASIGSLEENAQFLRSAVAAGSCWSLSFRDFPLSDIEESEVKDAYESRLVRGRGRGAYDRILSSAMRHQCPYCGMGSVSTLDHFLPKSSFGALAIEPWNLVPCCKDCNHAMGSRAASSEENELIHPYSWQDTTPWLCARLVAVEEPFAEFFPSMTPCGRESRRIAHHFARLKLGLRYAEASAAAIHETTQVVQHLRAAGDSMRIRDYLRELADSMVRAGGPNYWRAALCRGLSESEWYWTDWVWR